MPHNKQQHVKVVRHFFDQTQVAISRRPHAFATDDRDAGLLALVYVQQNRRKFPAQLSVCSERFKALLVDALTLATFGCKADFDDYRAFRTRAHRGSNEIPKESLTINNLNLNLGFYTTRATGRQPYYSLIPVHFKRKFQCPPVA